MTDKERLEIYETFLHSLAIPYGVSMNPERVKKGLDIVWDWYRAHSDGNGELSQEEIEDNINKSLRRMEEY